MTSQSINNTKLTTVASFPAHFFLEGMAARTDGSILVTVANRREVWYIPPPAAGGSVEPVHVTTFPQSAMAVVEVTPDVFYVAVSPVMDYQSAALAGQPYTPDDSCLYRLDLRHWTPGEQAKAEPVLRFPETARGLNGGCVIAPGTILIADCFAGLIWRVDLPANGSDAEARAWLKHESMDSDPGGPAPDQPGINGLQYAASSNYLFYTSTAQELFMRVRVDPDTHEPAAEPEFVAAGMMGDDFCLDDQAGFAYIATHRQNTIDRVALEPAGNSYLRRSVAGKPFTMRLIGPTNGVWGRGPGDSGRVAYFLADGGTKAPPPLAGGIARPATVVRVEF